MYIFVKLCHPSTSWKKPQLWQLLHFNCFFQEFLLSLIAYFKRGLKGVWYYHFSHRNIPIMSCEDCAIRSNPVFAVSHWQVTPLSSSPFLSLPTTYIYAKGFFPFRVIEDTDSVLEQELPSVLHNLPYYRYR